MAPFEDGTNSLSSATKHAFPSINIPDPVIQGSKPMFPELFFSVYADQDVEVCCLDSVEYDDKDD